MSRGNGRVFHPMYKDPKTGEWVKTKTWRLDYSINGQRFLESARTTSRRVALALLHERVGGRRGGTVIGEPDRVTLADLRALVERQYVLDGRRSLVRVTRSLAHLERILGATTRAQDLTTPRIDTFRERRLGEGAARATVNQELAALRRGFRLAMKKGLLSAMPLIELPKVHNERRGFFEPGDVAALELELPEPIRSVIRFTRLTGWRTHKDVLPLTWAAVDWDDQGSEGAPAPAPGPHACIRLMQAETKGGEARVFPFAEAPELKALLLERWAARAGLFVFHRNGKRVSDFRGAWQGACKRAGLAGHIPHEFRRTFAREMRQAGVSEGEIMKLAGWRTRSMFDRYNIIDDRDLAAAVAKRYGQVAVKIEPVPTS